ncbi:unnamed protein product [Brassica oleracea]
MAKERILNLDNNGFSLDLRRKAMRCWTGSVTLIFRSGLMGGLLQVVELSYPTVVEITTKYSRLRWIRVRNHLVNTRKKEKKRKRDEKNDKRPTGKRQSDTLQVPFLLPPLSLSSLQLCFFLNQNSTNSSPTRFQTTTPLFASSPPSFLCGTHRIGSKFRLGRKIGSGSFQEIYIELMFRPTKRSLLSIKLVSLFKLLLKLKDFISFSGFTNMKWFGVEGDHIVLVMDLLGPSLEDLFGYCNMKFTLKTVLMLADQMINRLEFIHSKSYLHRDVKPDNFLMGLGRRTNQVYIIDFGLAKKYRDSSTHRHIPYRFDDNPDYAYLKRLFRNLFIREGFQFDFVFDWTVLKYQQSPHANDGGVGTSSGLLNHAVSNAEKRPDSTLKQKTKNANESAIAKDKLAPGSFHLGRSEGSSSRRVVDSSSREPLSGGSDYESALRGIDSMRIDNNAVNETAASPQSVGGDDSTPRIELKAKLSD